MRSLLAEALPVALEITGARAALVRHDGPGGPRLVAHVGEAVDPDALDPANTWSQVLPGDAGEFVLVGGPTVFSGPGVRAAAALMEAVVVRARAEQNLADLVERVDVAQQLANMGDYDWHIASDTNRWSDQLYRIYGHEPGAFTITYDTFLEHIHPEDRELVRSIHERAYATGQPYEMVERIVRPDGTVRFLSSSGRVLMGPTGTPERMTGTCVDITERVEAEQARETVSAALHEAELRRRQAMEVNDNVIQGLTAAVLCMQAGDVAGSTRYLERTLTAARHLMSEWLNPLGSPAGDDGVRPGDLVRAEASRLEPQPQPQPQAQPQPQPQQPPLSLPEPRRSDASGLCRVLIAEDSSDVRLLLRRRLEVAGVCDVVGEAGDGAEAVQLAEALQPDIVLLDLSMPRMDGLQALPLIRQAAPGARVVVMSGFADAQMADTALAAGAVRYVEKGLRMDPVGLIEGLLKIA